MFPSIWMNPLNWILSDPVDARELRHEENRNIITAEEPDLRFHFPPNPVLHFFLSLQSNSPAAYGGFAISPDHKFRLRNTP